MFNYKHYLYAFVEINVLLQIISVTGHPQCLDFRPPFELVESLDFCTEYGSFGCCTKERDDELRRLYEQQLGGPSVPADSCLGFIKTIMCQECSPYAAHVYDAEYSEQRNFPGLCFDYCKAVFEACATEGTLTYLYVYQLIGEDIKKATSKSISRLCKMQAISDMDYCYPDLLTNDVLNTDISDDAITQDGCLCLEKFASDLSNPLIFRAPPDGTGRVFIGEQRGVVHVYMKDGTKIEPPFMDISNMVLTSKSKGDERGLLGLAFHPDYKDNRRFFTFSTVSLNGRNTTRISEFRADAMDPNRADASPERIIMEIDQPYSNHNGGEILFGVDGYLYLFIGDGGAGGDPQNNAQNLETLLGKVLRIDVDSPPDPGLNYKVPDDNPFVGDNRPTSGTRQEIYAYGIRNIWRCDVDEGDPETGEHRGRIICGDVGQSRFEELNVIVSGGNYGWNTREGFQCYRNETCGRVGPEELPIYAYSHSEGKSVTGGHMYRGCMNPNLNGKYIYGDYIDGKVWTLEQDANDEWINTRVTMCGTDVCFNGLESYHERNILSFGEDDDGEVYMLTTSYASPTTPRASVYKFVDPRRYVAEYMNERVRSDKASCRPNQGGTDGETVPPIVRPTDSPTDRPTAHMTTDGAGGRDSGECARYIVYAYLIRLLYCNVIRSL